LLMMQKIKDYLDRHLPPAKYSDGKKTPCLFYRACNVFDLVDD